ncbi:hypothetical protein [Pseudomonas phage PseuP_222]|nr:hypothetical protein [Pseudomonas phage PseuP_222]
MRAIWSCLKKIWIFLRAVPGKLIELLLMITGIPWLSGQSSKWFARRKRFMLAAICANLLFLVFMGLSIWGITAHWSDWQMLQFVSAFLSLAYMLLLFTDAVQKSYKGFKEPKVISDTSPNDGSSG